MLAAMTYSAELFAAALAGLTVGHALCNLQAPPPANADPCCPDARTDLMDLTGHSSDFSRHDDVAMSALATGRNSQQYQKIV